MNNKSIDLYVYIQSKEVKDINADIVDAVSSQKGILKAGNNSRIKKMMDILYDPELTSGIEIINFIRNKGCNGYLVGM